MLEDVEEGVSKRTMHQGYLRKWTNYFKNYQRRWFIYYKGILSYYKARTDVGQVTQSQISMANARIIVFGEYSFKIFKSKNCVFSLKADNKEDFDTWIDVLQNAINEYTDVALDSGSPSILSEKSSLINNNSSHSFEEFYNQRDKFLYSAMNVRENCRQMTMFASDIHASFQYLLANINKKSLESNTDTVKNLKENINTFEQLNQKVQKSIEELARSSDLLAEFAAATRASNLQNQVQLSTSKTISSDSQTDNLMQETSKSNYYTDTNPNEEPLSEQDEDGIFFDACENISPVQEKKEFHEVSPIEISGSLSPPLIKSKRSSGSSSRICGKSLQHFRSSSDIKINVTLKSQKDYRTSIPPKPFTKASLWTTIRHNIGKDLSKISIPVEFNDPISMLQRATETLEYSYLLDKAATCDDPLLQMCYVAAFSVSGYCSTSYRTNKAFNPLLGETYEMDRSQDLGWRSICEQVSHHPPICSIHVEGNGWIFWETINLKSKFRAKYLLIEQLGLSQIIFTRTGFRYTWDKVSTTVNNIMIGSLWIDHYGTMHLENKSTGDSSRVEFIPCGFLSKTHPKKVTGVVKDKNDLTRYSINGFWDRYLECSKILPGVDNSNGNMISRQMLFSAHPIQPGADKMYYFSAFTCSLNDFEPDIPPTDSRFRPDQRAMEAGNMDQANTIKVQLEDKQRQRTKKALEQAHREGKVSESTAYEDIYTPLWFKLDPSCDSNHPLYLYKGGYWESKKKKDFSICPHIFNLV